jgi:hypothetical protein
MARKHFGAKKRFCAACGKTAYRSEGAARLMVAAMPEGPQKFLLSVYRCPEDGASYHFGHGPRARRIFAAAGPDGGIECRVR